MASDPQNSPPIIDPNHPPEIFVTDVAHIGILDGAVVITLASLRADVTTGQEKVERQKVVVGRLVLTNRAAGELLNMLQGLAQRLNLLNKPAVGTRN